MAYFRHRPIRVNREKVQVLPTPRLEEIDRKLNHRPAYAGAYFCVCVLLQYFLRRDVYKLCVFFWIRFFGRPEIAYIRFVPQLVPGDPALKVLCQRPDIILPRLKRLRSVVYRTIPNSRLGGVRHVKFVAKTHVKPRLYAARAQIVDN